jgi:hypothetical protein
MHQEGLLAQKLLVKWWRSCYYGSISTTFLREAFTRADPKSAKRLSSNQCLFALLGSACKMMTKLALCYTFNDASCNVVKKKRALKLKYRSWSVSIYHIQKMAKRILIDLKFVFSHRVKHRLNRMLSLNYYYQIQYISVITNSATTKSRL